MSALGKMAPNRANGAVDQTFKLNGQIVERSSTQNDADTAIEDYRHEVPDAEATILERLVSALVTENILDLDACAVKGVQVSVARASVSRRRLVNPITACGRVIESPVEFLTTLLNLGLLAGDWDAIVAEVSDSVQNLAMARAAAAQRARQLQTLRVSIPDAPFTSLSQTLTVAGYGPHALAGFEQWVIDGHPHSPSAKIRIGMSPVDARHFAPEFGVTIGLRFVAVRKSHVVGESGGEPDIAPSDLNAIGPHRSADAMRDLFLAAFPHVVTAGREQLAAEGLSMDNYALIPTHPHQIENALPDLIPDALASRLVIPINATVPATPLMSMRSLLVKGARSLHIKTALEVQLTGCIRGVSTTSVHNGPRISRLLSRIIQTDLDLQLSNSGGSIFNVAQELAGIAFSGTPRALGSLIRQDPEDALGPGEVAMPIAAFLARSPLSPSYTILEEILAERHASASEGTTLSQIAHAWLRAHASIAIPACLTLMTRYGISLEPHPQNMVLVLKRAWPHSVYVRDYGGARVMPSRLARRGFAVELEGDTGLITDDAAALRAKLYYPLFGNQFAGLVAALASAAKCNEHKLWDVVRHVASDTFSYLEQTATCVQEATDTREDAGALLMRPWPRKTLIAMRLAGAVTEQMYVSSPNPLALAVQTTEPDSPVSSKLNHPEARMLEFLRTARSPLLEGWLGNVGPARADTMQDQLGAMAHEGLDMGDDVVRGHTAQWERVQSELADSACNLALARAAGTLHGRTLCLQTKVLNTTNLLDTLRDRTPSDLHVDLEVLCVEGHRRHPCRRARAGFSPQDSIAYAPEFKPTVGLQLVAVSRSLVCSTPDECGRSVGGVLSLHYPHIMAAAAGGLIRRGLNPSEYELIPAHPWQAKHAIPRDYAPEIAAAAVVVLPEAQIPCRPTVSTRTLITAAPGALGQRLSIKTAIDVQITSAVRTISPATVSNGPPMSRFLEMFFRSSPLTEGRVTAVHELAGICFSDCGETRSRGLSAVVRADFTQHLKPGEVAISGAALVAISPLTETPVVQELVDQLALATATPRPQAAIAWMGEYSNLLWCTTLPLLWEYGIALESHLQNTVVVVNPQRSPARLLVRDLGGMRIHTGRFAGSDISVHPDSVILASHIQDVYDKFTHAVVFGNLAEIVHALSGGSPQTVDNLWDCVRSQLFSVYESFVRTNDPTSAHRDLQVLLARTLKHKALLTMRVVPAAGDCYVKCANPLYRPHSSAEDGDVFTANESNGVNKVVS